MQFDKIKSHAKLNLSLGVLDKLKSKHEQNLGKIQVDCIFLRIQNNDQKHRRFSERKNKSKKIERQSQRNEDVTQNSKLIERKQRR